MADMKNTIEKIVINSSFGRLTTGVPDFEGKVLPEIEETFAAITGQKGQRRPARVSISGFKLREGLIIGIKSTLRGARAKQFLHRVVSIVLPRIRDFQGIALSSIDTDGNLTFGVKEHTVFPEIILEKSRVSYGIQLTVVPRARMDQAEALAFYKSLGVPFAKEKARVKSK